MIYLINLLKSHFFFTVFNSSDEISALIENSKNILQSNS